MKSKILLLLFLCTSLHFLKAQIKGVEGKNGKWGLADGSGKMITQSIYDNMGNFGRFSEGLVAVWLNKKSGYIDTTGKVIIAIKYDECNEFKSGTATVWLGNKCGLIDKTGKLLIPFKYELLTKLNENLWSGSTAQNKYGLLTNSGKELLPAVYDMIKEPGNGYGILTIKKKKGYYNNDGKITIPCKFDEARIFQEGIAAVSINEKWGFIDISGQFLLPMEYESKPFMSNGTEIIKKNGKYEPFVKPKIKPPLTASDVIANHINRIGGQINLAALKTYQFTVEVFNYKKILYTTTEVYHSGNNIHAVTYDNNSKNSTTRIMTGGEMWLKENEKVIKDDHETDNVFTYSLPSLLSNAEKTGYSISYDPKKCEETGVIYLVITGKEKLKTDYIFSFTDDYSIKEI